MQEHLPHPVLAAEQRRAAAVTSRDVVTLAQVLHDELVYVHATGARHGKADLLQFVAKGPAFLEVDFGVQLVLDLDDAALLHGELRLQLRRVGELELVTAQSWASALWQREPRGGWQLRLFHSTRPA